MKSLLLYTLILLLAPFYVAIIQKTKAFFGGRQGPPWFINYYTLIKLLRKGSVYSRSTTLVFRLSPVIGLAVVLVALSFFPVGGLPALFSFRGDVILVLYLLGLSRFFTILAGLDTASPFQGMGTAREAFYAIFAELSLFMILILFCLAGGELSLSGYLLKGKSLALHHQVGPPLILVIAALFMILLSENARVPVDDPTTHLELTMIHEVMILDHSGPDLALIEWGAQLKLVFFAGIVTCLVLPLQFGSRLLDLLAFFVVLGLVYVVIGITESIMARFKLPKVPKFLLTSFALAFFATVVILEFRS